MGVEEREGGGGGDGVEGDRAVGECGGWGGACCQSDASAPTMLVKETPLPEMQEEEEDERPSVEEKTRACLRQLLAIGRAKRRPGRRGRGGSGQKTGACSSLHRRRKARRTGRGKTGGEGGGGRRRGLQLSSCTMGDERPETKNAPFPLPEWEWPKTPPASTTTSRPPGRRLLPSRLPPSFRF